MNSVAETTSDSFETANIEDTIEKRKSNEVNQKASNNNVSLEGATDGDDELDARRRSRSVVLDIEEPTGEDEEPVTARQSNTYAAKKTVAQGMMDIALITANANQLRYIIEFNRNSSTFYLTVCLIVISLGLQVAVGVSLIFKGRLDLKGQSKHRYATRINNYVVVGVFLVTIINVFIASFTITGNTNNSNNNVNPIMMART